MLREIGLTASIKLKVPKEQRVYVARNRGNNEIAPSEQLLREFKRKSKALGGTTEAHNRAFKSVRYEQRFRKQVLSNPVAMKKLETLSKESKDRDIFFICYEGLEKACHRRILLRICEEKFGARIHLEGVEP